MPGDSPVVMAPSCVLMGAESCGQLPGLNPDIISVGPPAPDLLGNCRAIVRNVGAAG